MVAERRTGRVYEATLATNDPLGRRLTVRIEPDADGVIALRAAADGGGRERTGHRLPRPPGERYLGFGERSNAVDQRGNERGELRGRGPLSSRTSAPIVPAFVPPWGFQPRDDATYFPVPWLLSTRGYGVLVDNTETSYFRLGTDSPGAWSVEVRGAPLRPARVRQARELGRRAAPASTGADRPPAARRHPSRRSVYFGPWYQPRDDEEAILVAQLRARRRAAVGGPDLHPLPAVRGPARAAGGEQRARTARLHAPGWP